MSNKKSAYMHRRLIKCVGIRQNGSLAPGCYSYSFIDFGDKGDVEVTLRTSGTFHIGKEYLLDFTEYDK